MGTVRLDLAYDGTDFHGWARQRDPSIRTIEGELLHHLERVLRERPVVSVGGRTDAGVHARGQVATFRTDRDVSPGTLREALNGALGPEVVVTATGPVAEGFDARFSASAREYRYVIDVAPIPDPFTARYVWHRPGDLRLGRMREAAAPLIGEHDFTSFCRHPGADRSTVRNVTGLSVSRRGDRIEVGIRANAFLHQMVRSIVGTLVSAGEGRIDPAGVPEILVARDRSAAGSVAPARGLTLDRIVYRRRTAEL